MNFYLCKWISASYSWECAQTRIPATLLIHGACNNKYIVYAKLSEARRLERLAEKQPFNEYLAAAVLRVDVLNGHVDSVIVLLAHWSEDFTTLRTLCKAGIAPSRQHVPQPTAYARSCDVGFANVHHCWLSELPPLLGRREVCGLGADFDVTWPSVRDELAAFLLQARLAQHVVLGLNVYGSRHDVENVWFNDMLPFLQSDVLDKINYKFHDIGRTFKRYNYRKMFSYVLILRRRKPRT